MIFLYNAQNRHVGAYKDFEGLCDYFRRMEYFKDHPPSPPPSTPSAVPEGYWNFICHPHRRLSAIFGCITGLPGTGSPWKEGSFTKQEHEAYGNGFDLIEIYTGGPNPRQIVLTPDIDVPGLMRDWCFGYSYAKSYVLLEAIRGCLDLENPWEHVPATCGYQSFLHHPFLDALERGRLTVPHKFSRDGPSEYGQGV